MKIILMMAAFSLLISCAHQHEVSPQIQKNKEYITQVDVKVSDLQSRMQRIEDLTKEILVELKGLKEAQKNLAQSQAKPQEKATTQLPPLPVLVDRKPWTPKFREMSTRLVKRFDSSKESTESNSPWVGKKFPMVRFVNSDGQVLDLEQYRGKKKVLLVVLRGFAGGVCIVCSSQTLALSKNIQKFRDSNTEVVVVYPGTVNSIPGFLESIRDLESEFELPFSIALDPDFSLVDNLQIKSDLAKPSTFLMDEEGTIRYSYIGKHPGDRPSVPDILQKINNL